MEAKDKGPLVADITGRCIAGAVGVMIEQRAKGQIKYGVSIEDAPLNTDQLLRHLQEELADGAVHLQRLIELIEAERAEWASSLLELLGADAHDDLKLEMVRDFAQTSGGRATQGLVMYVQPSQLEEFNRTNANLLTLSRSNTFPFTQKVKVTL